MSYKTENGSMEPFVVAPFVNFLQSAIDAEITDNPIALRNISEMGYTLGTLNLKKDEGEAIRELKIDRAKYTKLVFTHFAKILQNESRKNEDTEREIILLRDYVKNEVSRTYDRYIIRICTFAFRRAPLKQVSVNDDFSSELFFNVAIAKEDAKTEVLAILDLYKIEV